MADPDYARTKSRYSRFLAFSSPSNRRAVSSAFLVCLADLANLEPGPFSFYAPSVRKQKGKKNSKIVRFAANLRRINHKRATPGSCGTIDRIGAGRREGGARKTGSGGVA